VIVNPPADDGSGAGPRMLEPTLTGLRDLLLGKADSQDYVLLGHGRYSHSASYVLQTMGDAGLTDVQTQPVVLRNEGGKPVDGWLVSARAP
jgi:hypothetical protein